MVALVIKGKDKKGRSVFIRFKWRFKFCLFYMFWLLDGKMKVCNEVLVGLFYIFSLWHGMVKLYNEILVGFFYIFWLWDGKVRLYNKVLVDFLYIFWLWDGSFMFWICLGRLNSHSLLQYAIIRVTRFNVYSFISSCH